MGDVMYSTVTIVNKTVLHIWKLLRVNLKNSYHKKNNFVTMYGDKCLLD